MKRYTYQDLVLARKTKHSYTKQIEKDVRILLNQYKVISETTIYKILICRENYKTVKPLDLLITIQNTIKKGDC